MTLFPHKLSSSLLCDCASRIERRERHTQRGGASLFVALVAASQAPLHSLVKQTERATALARPWRERNSSCIFQVVGCRELSRSRVLIERTCADVLERSCQPAGRDHDGHHTVRSAVSCATTSESMSGVARRCVRWAPKLKAGCGRHARMRSAHERRAFAAVSLHVHELLVNAQKSVEMHEQHCTNTMIGHYA